VHQMASSCWAQQIPTASRPFHRWTMPAARHAQRLYSFSFSEPAL
jgi:hypothetical protein